MNGKIDMMRHALLAAIMGVSVTSVTALNLQAGHAAKTPMTVQKRVAPSAIFFAEKEVTVSTDNGAIKSDSEQEGTEKRPVPKTDKEGRSKKTKPAPLKPFVPSEEIPGEQAVDFPVDI